MNITIRVLARFFRYSDRDTDSRLEDKIEKGFEKTMLNFSTLQADVDKLNNTVVPALQALDTSLQQVFKTQSDLIAQLQAAVNAGDTINQPIIDQLDANLQAGENALNTLASDLGHVVTPALTPPPPATPPPTTGGTLPG